MGDKFPNYCTNNLNGASSFDLHDHVGATDTIILDGTAAVSGTYPGGNTTTTIWNSGNIWFSPNDEPCKEDYKMALKLLHDPEFDLGKVMLEMVARYLAWKRNDPEVFDDPVIQKSKK